MDKIPETFKSQLMQVAGEGNVLVDEAMANHTTFRIGGPADYFVMPQSVDELAAVIALCTQQEVPFRIMGLGSNLLVADAGLRGVVIQLAERFAAISVEGTHITAQAGASNADVARAALDAGLAGYEFASGIPGSIGGAAIMNAGAYGGEFKDVAISVRCLMSDGSVCELSRDEACWTYRHSRMMDEDIIVLEATLELQPDDPAAIKDRLRDFAHRRTSKQPLDMPSAGSTFKRPEGYYVGPLLEEAGLKGFHIGGAQVSPKHAGFVVNAGGATAQDVLDLIAHVQTVVRERYGVELQPEVRLWS